MSGYGTEFTSAVGGISSTAPAAPNAQATLLQNIVTALNELKAQANINDNALMMMVAEAFELTKPPADYQADVINDLQT